MRLTKLAATMFCKSGVQPRNLQHNMHRVQRAAPPCALAFRRLMNGGGGLRPPLTSTVRRLQLRLCALPTYRLARKTAEDIAADVRDPSTPNGARFPFKVRLASV